MNKVILIGNLTKAPETSRTNNGVMYSRFSIAVNREYRDDRGDKITDYFNVIAWRGLAELANKYLDKGRKVCVVGQIQTRSYENKDGVKVNTFDIVADEIEFLTPKPQTTDIAPPIDLEEVKVGVMPF